MTPETEAHVIQALGRVEGKLDAALTRADAQDKRVDGQDKRLRAIEQRVWWSWGVGAAAFALIGAKLRSFVGT
jgi:hypothetical protein